jgi:hypothetical protein
MNKNKQLSMCKVLQYIVGPQESKKKKFSPRHSTMSTAKPRAPRKPRATKTMRQKEDERELSLKELRERQRIETRDAVRRATYVDKLAKRRAALIEYNRARDQYVEPVYTALLDAGVPLTVAKRAYEMLHYVHCSANYPGLWMTNPNDRASVDCTEYVPPDCDVRAVLTSHGFAVDSWRPTDTWGNFFICFTYAANTEK